MVDVKGLKECGVISQDMDGFAGGGEGISWSEKFETFLVEDLVTELLEVTPYSTNEANKRVVSEKLEEAFQAFVNFLVSGPAIGKKRLKSLCSGLFCHVDLYVLSLRRVSNEIAALVEERHYWNVFFYLRFLPVPNKKLQAAFFESEANFVKPGVKNAKVRRLYQDAWLALIKHELPPPLLKQLVPYLCESALSAMREGYLFGDFLFRVFKMGDIFAILSLDGIFKLITEHNFEYPDFYACVYGITTPSICYLSYRKRFFILLDTFLASTHLPTYVVAAFVKRLCRLSLTAPLACQEPLLSLIRNLLIRHEGVRPLLHRDEPVTVDHDPYDETEKNLQECGASESSLWEIKTIQRHWYLDVAKRANFVDRGVQRSESFVRWRSDDEYFSNMMSKKFGSDLAKSAEDLKYQKNQGASSEDEDEENAESKEESGPTRKRRRIENKVKRFEDKREFAVPTNFKEPATEFLPNRFQFAADDFWKL